MKVSMMIVTVRRDDNHPKNNTNSTSSNTTTKNTCRSYLFLPPSALSPNRSFYEDLPDLLNTVPPNLLGLTEDQAEQLRGEERVKQKERAATETADSSDVDDGSAANGNAAAEVDGVEDNEAASKEGGKGDGDREGTEGGGDVLVDELKGLSLGDDGDGDGEGCTDEEVGPKCMFYFCCGVKCDTSNLRLIHFFGALTGSVDLGSPTKVKYITHIKLILFPWCPFIFLPLSHKFGRLGFKIGQLLISWFCSYKTDIWYLVPARFYQSKYLGLSFFPKKKFKSITGVRHAINSGGVVEKWVS